VNRKRGSIKLTVPAHVRQHLTSQPSSGLSVQQYCDKHSISTWSFYQWRKRYQSRLGAVKSGQLSFAELSFVDNSGGIYDIRFPSGLTVSVHRGATPDELATIFTLAAAAGKPC